MNDAPPAPALHFLIPGDPETLTGGFLYDKRIIAGLRAAGRSVRTVRLADGFPEPDAAALAGLTDALAAIPNGATVVVDGLALGVAAAAVRPHAARLCLIGLVHHPLAAETGLDPARARDLARAERAALGLVRGVVATSRQTAAVLAHDYAVPAARLAVVEPGTDPAPLAAGSGAAGPRRLLTVGTLTPRKGHRVLIEALARVADLDWRVDIVGATDRDPATAAAVREAIGRAGLGARIAVLGSLDGPGLAAAYHQADLFVSGTFYEGFGMVFTEALARGLAIVSTAGGAVGDTVPAAAGYLAPPGDAAVLAQGLRAVLADPAAFQRLRSGAAAARTRLADWPTQAARFARALDLQAPAPIDQTA